MNILLFSYDKFRKKLERNGLTLNQLKNDGILTDHAYNAMLRGESVGVDKIAKICRHLNLPIQDVVEINYSNEPKSSDD